MLDAAFPPRLYLEHRVRNFHISLSSASEEPLSCCHLSVGLTNVMVAARMDPRTECMRTMMRRESFGMRSGRLRATTVTMLRLVETRTERAKRILEIHLKRPAYQLKMSSTSHAYRTMWVPSREFWIGSLSARAISLISSLRSCAWFILAAWTVGVMSMSRTCMYSAMLRTERWDPASHSSCTSSDTRWMMAANACFTSFRSDTPLSTLGTTIHSSPFRYSCAPEKRCCCARRASTTCLPTLPIGCKKFVRVHCLSIASASIKSDAWFIISLHRASPSLETFVSCCRPFSRLCW
mmetsp:Transcript_3515/g.8101  ORF Transcript_3515/g.8101 Transcript_3515/m.8101 type:complete len:294 (+) Transcript_3515:154-1035(+)